MLKFYNTHIRPHIAPTPSKTTSQPSLPLSSPSTAPPTPIPTPPFPFLNLPLKLRQKIYTHLSHTSPYLTDLETFTLCAPNLTSTRHLYASNPTLSPLYPLLFVSRQLRIEVSPFLYRPSAPIMKGTFAFGYVGERAPGICKRFLEITRVGVGGLTSLSLSVRDSEVGSLEGVWREIVESGAKLRVLGIEILCLGKKEEGGGDGGRLGKFEDVRRGCGLDGKGAMDEMEVEKEEENQRRLNRAWERAQELQKRYEATSAKKKTSLEESRSNSDLNEEDCASWLGRMENIEVLVIDGNAFGYWSVEFEIAVLKLHESMLNVAQRTDLCNADGIKYYGRWGDWYWYGSNDLESRRELTYNASGDENDKLQLWKLNPALK